MLYQPPATRLLPDVDIASCCTSSTNTGADRSGTGSGSCSGGSAPPSQPPPPDEPPQDPIGGTLWWLGFG